MRHYGQERDKTVRTLLLSAFITTFLLYWLLDPLREKETSLSSTPQVSATTLPDFESYRDTAELKQAFFQFLKPIVEQANREILDDRKKLNALIDIFQHKNGLSDRQWKKLFVIAKKYRFPKEAHVKDKLIIEELDRRVHPVPVSLVLAQAANESSWGRSRFAKEGNNLFGQWCFQSGCGIVPGDRADDKEHEVAVFDSVLDSVKSYLMNLNSFHAYKALREKRSALMATHEKVTGIALAEGLVNYSTRREAYVKEIQQMIQQNNLE